MLHEFQSIPGVVEDATDIILNPQQIPFKLNGDGAKAIYLKTDQPGVITLGYGRGGMRTWKCSTRMSTIATVSEGGKLDDGNAPEARGRGYVSA